MKASVSVFGLSLVATISLCSCKAGAPAAKGPASTPVRPGQAQTVAVKPPEAPPPPAMVFSYDPNGLRDPFEPFIKIEEKKQAAQPAPKAFVARTPLQRFSLDEIKLVGVLWTPAGKATALVEDPQNKGYMVSVGAYLGDRGGKIVRIQPDRVVIEERFSDVLGQEKVNVSNIVLHKSEGEVRP